MNPLTNVKNQNKINERELQQGLTGTNSSWHRQYRGSAWIFFGGVAFELTEGDLICVFSQYGEIVNINLIRDKKTGKSKGFGFVCYEDQRSTDLAVDNFNGIQLLGRIIRVDHVLNYRPPKENEEEDDIISKFLKNKGCAPETIEEKIKKYKEAKQKSSLQPPPPSAVSLPFKQEMKKETESEYERRPKKRRSRTRSRSKSREESSKLKKHHKSKSKRH